MKRDVRIYVAVAGVILLILMIGVVLYGKWFPYKPEMQPTNEQTQSSGNTLQEPIQVQLSDQNGEEKVSDIPIQITQAGQIEE